MVERNPFKDIAIVGVGETQVGKVPGVSAIQFQAEAGLRALQDAGLDKAEVDGVFSFGPYSRPVGMHSSLVLEYMGIKPTFNAQVDVGGATTPMMAMFLAASAIAAGQCRVALCTFGENGLSVRTAGEHGRRPGALTGGEEFEEPFGCIGAVIPYAMIAQRHMHEYGTTSRQLGAVAVAARKHASLNPAAYLRQPITIEDHQASRMIATPFHLLDCSIFTDGGGAVVLTTRERARHLRKPPISILGFGLKSTHKQIIQFPELRSLGLREAAHTAYLQAGVTPQDIDVAQIHDAFTISVIVAVEALGFCGEGEGGPYCAAGNLELGSKTPVNTHGGLLSFGHVGGIHHVTEAVKQLRGECDNRQVPGARLALVSGNGGFFSVCGVMILGRE